MRVDAHHHVWDLAVRPQPWIGADEARVIGRSFSPDDWLAAAAGTGVGHAVVVQTVPDPAETPELLAATLVHPHLVGVVGWIPGDDGDGGDGPVDRAGQAPRTGPVPGPAERIARWRALPGGDRLVGLRDLTQYRRDRHWLAGPEARGFARAAGDARLAVDLLVEPDQLADAAGLARDVPATRFVLDHLGKPDLDALPPREWARAVAGLAALPHVACKVSGTATLCRDPRTAPLAGYLERALDLFGPDRLVAGSDWPVMLLGGLSYAEQLELVEARAAAAGLDAAGLARLRGGTAVEWYRLDVGGGVAGGTAR